MTKALVIHCASDRKFVQDQLLPALPSLGFTAWTGDWKNNMAWSRVVLVVVSKAASDDDDVREGTETARDSGISLISILTDDTARGNVAATLKGRVAADFRKPFEEAYWALAQILPPIDSEDPSDTPVEDSFEPIDWNEGVFSGALGGALGWQDHTTAAGLIGAFERHAANRPYPYGVNEAVRDLKTLKRYRKFGLIVRLGASFLATGTKGKGTVRKMYAQALIEQRDYDRALEVLDDILRDQDSDPFEINEAKGLIGRIFKQRYVNQPNGVNAPDDIRRAIRAYGEVYNENAREFWHGINTASCILRAHRDGISGLDPDRAKAIAETILADLANKENKKALPLWDRATRVEACLVLARYEEANEALHAYLNAFSADDDSSPYPFFELASTQRQFDEVLELDKLREGRPLLEKLTAEVERYRSGTVLRPDPPRGSNGSETLGGVHDSDIVKRLPLLIRVGDPGWKPREDVPDLEITARMETVISARGTEATRKALLRDLDVISVEESYPAGSEECEKSVPFIGASNVWETKNERGAGALVAVIDNGIDVLHEAFLDEHGVSRIVEIWDQKDDTGQSPPDFKHGTHHTAEDIARYVKNHTVPQGLGRNRHGHGSHVASIAAGRKIGDFAGGVAPEAKLVIVRSAPTESLGYSVSHVEALHYIDGVARKLGMPVVVNVSQGMNAGAHDGKSTLEVAFNEFSSGGRKPGRVIVKSAGNERQKNGHAKVIVGAGSKEAITWKRPADAYDSERIELWWSAADEMLFRLRNPHGDWTDWVGEGPKLEGTFPSGDKFALEYVRRHRDNGDSRLLIEIRGASGSLPAAGEWKLEIGADQVPLGGEVHAWIERGAGAPSGFTTHANEEITLSIPGTAADVIAVGAVEHGEYIGVGEFSSYGPTRDGRNKPEIAAPGVGIRAADGGTADKARPDTGTSMAAPHVTGAIALLLSKNPRLVASQISTALWQTTKNFNGKWNPGQGYGVLHVENLMSAL